MIKAIAFLFLVNSAGAATFNPLTSCLNLLSGKSERTVSPSEVQFNQIVRNLRAAGADELLAPLDRGEIKLQFKTLRMPWQSRISGREGWLGGLTLKIRGGIAAGEKEKQTAVWETAVALFELESRSALWTRRSMLTPDGQREFDLSMGGSDESLEYFVMTQPREWRDQQLARIEKLEGELYRVFTSLYLLKAQDQLPKKDPGRFWKLRSIYGGDASRAIAPNQADFEIWKKSGVVPDQTARHGRSLFFNYYMNFAKRAVILSMVAQIAIAAPTFAELPGYLDTMFAVNQTTTELNSSPARTIEFNERYIENLKKQVRREETRLQRAITREQASATPSSSTLTSLRQELTELYDLYPWLNHTK